MMTMRIRGEPEPPPPQQHQRLQSRIVSSVREKSREEVIEAQRHDPSGRDRNRRMFGALLGTLHRFSQDETKLKEKEEKRAQIEAKLEEQAMQEKESAKKEKLQLIRDRKIKLKETRRLEMKKRATEEMEEWETKTKCLRNFIRTEAKPPIFYLPKVMNPITECRLEASKQIVDEMIVNKRKLFISEWETEEGSKMKRYWDLKDEDQPKDVVKIDPVVVETQNESEDIGGRERLDPLEESMEDELKALLNEEKSSTNSEIMKMDIAIDEAE